MKKVLDITEILKIIPHRYPFLLIDKIIDMTEKTVTAIKTLLLMKIFSRAFSRSTCDARGINLGSIGSDRCGSYTCN